MSSNANISFIRNNYIAENEQEWQQAFLTTTSTLF